MPGDLIEFYGKVREEIELLSDDQALFVLDYIGHRQRITIASLSVNLGWSIARTLSTCENLASAGFLTSPTNPDTSVRLTERGKLTLGVALQRDIHRDDQFATTDLKLARGSIIKVVLPLLALLAAATVLYVVRMVLSHQLGVPTSQPIVHETSPIVTPQQLPAIQAAIALAQMSGDNAWMLVSSALMLMMIGPGLALFYGGLVRRKNVLGTMMQSFILTALVTVIWAVVGYSLVFGGAGPFIGDLHFALLNNVGSAPNPDYATTIPQQTFMIYQLMFAIITPALISGAFAERMKFSAMLLFTVLWLLLVYFPMAHMVWGKGGLLNAFSGGRLPIFDFAGGTVVHITSGVSALVCALYLGKRLGYPTVAMKPHSLVLSFIGACLLWVGWFGFNAGSALASSSLATSAFVATHFGASAAALGWLAAEWMHNGKPSVLGGISGCVAGLVAITPASGFVTPFPALLIGACAGLVCYFMVVSVKAKFGYDDSLDTFGIHGAGGTLGTILTGVFATSLVNDELKDAKGHVLPLGLVDGQGGQVLNQVIGCAVAWGLTIVGTLIILKVCDMLIGVRVTKEQEMEGVDLSQHGEEGYILEA